MKNIPKIKWQEEPNVVVIGGSEEYFKDGLVQDARLILSEYTYTLLWASQESDTVIKNHLFEGSFIPTNKLIVIRDANKVGNKAFLETYCKNPNPLHVLILIGSDGRLPKWFTSLKHEAKATCTPLKPWEYKEWVQEHCRKRGFSIDSGYAESIHANVGDDLYALSNELEKIFLGMGSRRTITPKDITSVLVQHQTINPFNVVTAWGTRQVDRALHLATVYFHQSLDNYAALPLIAMFLGQIEKLISFESYQKNDFSKTETCSLMGISPYVYDQVHRQALHWSLKELRTAYSQMCEIESQTKRGGSGPLLLSWFLSQEFEE